MMKKAIVSAAVLLLTYPFLSVAEIAQPPVAQELATRLEKVNVEMAHIKQQREVLLAQLQKIETQYGTIAGSLYELSEFVGNKRLQLNTLSVQISEKQQQLKAEKAVLNKQLSAAFVMGKKEKLKLLLNQQDPALASRMMVYYQYLNQTRLKKLAAIQARIAELAALEQDKQETADKLGQAIQAKEIKQADLAKTRLQRDTLLAQLKTDFALKTEQLNQLDKTEAQLETLIGNLQRSTTVITAPTKTPVIATTYPNNKLNPLYAAATNKPFQLLKNHLLWPVKGKILHRFGSRRSETRWDGVLIGAPEGAEIYAVSDGKVVFANWLRGYGLLTILDHGEGYMTLYAFNQSLYKKVGDNIKAGTAIAAVGKSDGRDEAGLYFGIRHEGKAINPALWCR
jgi:septal ring factor EnvC (AmiA/AmiB activator)